jgi:phosphopantothenoylcysteine decarboxylase / phosphopantothenate---cysteine ligase
MAILVTAGATRNPLDAVRYLSARSSGRTGVSIASALVARGQEVHLLGSAETLLRAPHLAGEEYGSTRDLLARMRSWVKANPNGGVIHSSAVGDYELAEDGSRRKIPSGQEQLVLTLSPTPKIADLVRGWGGLGPYVTFKAAGPETTLEQLVDICAAQRKRVGCDRVFGNILGKLGTDVVFVGESVATFSRRADAIDALVDWMVSRVV